MTADQNDILKLAVGMYKAAPGVAYMNELAGYLRGGMPIDQIYDALARSPSFQGLNPAYSASSTNQEFAAAFIDNLVGDAVGQADKDWAISWVKSMLDSGMSRGAVMKTAIDALDGVPEDHPVWGRAATLFDNRVSAAADFTLTLNGSDTDIKVLQRAIALVGEDTATVALQSSYNAEIIGNNNVNVPYLMDILNAHNVVDGGPGVDTLVVDGGELQTVTNDPAKAALFREKFIGFEKIEITTPGTAMATAIDAGALGGIHDFKIDFRPKDSPLTFNNLASGSTVEFQKTASDITLNLEDGGAGQQDELTFAIYAHNGDRNFKDDYGLSRDPAVVVNGAEKLNIDMHYIDSFPQTIGYSLSLDTTAKEISVAGDISIGIYITAPDMTFFHAENAVPKGIAGHFKQVAPNALIVGSAANDYLDAEYFAVPVSIDGGDGDDIIIGPSASSVLMGGNGNDHICDGPAADTIYGGPGDDSICLIYGNGDTVSGGPGRDAFDLRDFSTGNRNLNWHPIGNSLIHATITDLEKGMDRFVFSIRRYGEQPTFDNQKVTLANPQASFVDYLNAAAAGDGSANAIIRWFQYNGDTYLVQDMSAQSTFTQNADVAIKVTGLADFSTSILWQPYDDPILLY